jgi:hypothetical protein
MEPNWTRMEPENCFKDTEIFPVQTQIEPETTVLMCCAFGVKVSLFKPERSQVAVGPPRRTDQSPRPPLRFG